MVMRNFCRVAAILTVCMVSGNISAAPFTPGNLAIYRTGNGTDTMNNTAHAVFIDEYTPAGALVQSIALPTTVNGEQRRLVAQGSSQLEGLLNRSVDGRYLFLTGYDTNLGATTPSTTLASEVNRVVGRIDVSGNIDTSTILTDLDDDPDPVPNTTSGSVRSAISTNGTDIWVTGAEGGVRHVTFGNTGPSTQISADVTNLRHIDIFGGQLYISTGSGMNHRISAVGTGLPTTEGQTLTALPGLPTTGTPNPSPVQFFMADLSESVEGIDTLYVAEDRGVATGGGVHKWSLVEGTWTASGSISGDLNPGVSSLRGLTGVVDGTNVTLYGIRNNATLLRFEDNTGYNGTLSGSAVLLATAGAQTQFKGIDFVPIAASSFQTGDYNRNGVVDAADYVLWRDTLGTGVAQNGDGADGNENGTIDPDDYGVWVANFGLPNSGSGGVEAPAALVPEPATLSLVALAALMFVGRRFRRG